MTTFTFKISGTLTYNDAAGTEDGFATVAINEFITVDEMSAEKALENFLEENKRYDFFGKLKTCDTKTHGKKGATYKDQKENQTIDVELELVEYNA